MAASGICGAGPSAAGTRAASAALACAVAVAAVCRYACAQGRAAEVKQLEEHEIRGEGSVTRYVKYEGQLYRRIEANDLRSLVLGSTPLHGLRVCVEGKFDEAAGNTFRIMGSDRLFVVAGRQMVGGIMRGDNVWLGGQAKRREKDPSCYMEVHYVARLPRDTELFDHRFEKYAGNGDWERLLELADWIEASSRLAAGVRLENAPRRYRVLKDRADREALKIRERSLDPNDAEGWCQLAKIYLERLGRAGRLAAIRCLRRAYEADPGHEKAKELLSEMGQIIVDGRWMPKDEYEEIQREKARRLAEEREKRRAAEDVGTAAATEPARPKGLSLGERLARLLEVERKLRNHPRSLVDVAEYLGKEDDAVARQVVWVLANTGDIAGWKMLLKNLASLSATVRRDVADALASGEQLEELDDMIREERDPEISSHAVEALASIDPQKSMDKLVSLLSLKDEGKRSRVNAVLRRVTGQSHSGAGAWSTWWEDNRETFRTRPETP